MIRPVLVGAALALSSSAANAQALVSPTQADTYSSIPAADVQDLALLNAIMVEPRKLGSLADLMKQLPAGAIARLGSAQKAATERQAKD